VYSFTLCPSGYHSLKLCTILLQKCCSHLKFQFSHSEVSVSQISPNNGNCHSYTIKKRLVSISQWTNSLLRGTKFPPIIRYKLIQYRLKSHLQCFSTSSGIDCASCYERLQIWSFPIVSIIIVEPEWKENTASISKCEPILIHMLEYIKG
jgi:hypothetical protein